MSQPSPGRRAAHRADRLDAKKAGERTGSRPKPAKAGARSAALSPAEHRATAKHHSCFSAKLGGDREGMSTVVFGAFLATIPHPRTVVPDRIYGTPVNGGPAAPK